MNITESLIQYFEKGATDKKRIGLEIEHFVMKNGSPLSYSKGVKAILEELSQGAERKFFETGNIIGSDMGDYTLTLEPAAQLEVSVCPMENTEGIYFILQSFYKKAEAVLRKYSAELKTIPALSDELLSKTELIPKERYKYMDAYFKSSGTMGKKMMCGSTSVQVSVDYKNEADFVDKFRAAYILSPIFAYLMSEDKAFKRVEIWDNVDSSRTYIPKSLFSPDFGFKSYAEELLEVPAIFIPKDGEYIYTGEKTIGELSEELEASDDIVEHFLSMVFPDVRLKKYIEIRIADSTSAEKATEYAELVKTLFYTEALGEALTRYKAVTTEDIKAAKRSLTENLEKIAGEAEYILKLASRYGYNRRLI